MNCSKCTFSYNKKRQPLVFPCGHTFCSYCVPLLEGSQCFYCGASGKPAVNYAILDHLVKKNTSNIDKYIKICLFGNIILQFVRNPDLQDQSIVEIQETPMDVGKSSLLKRLIDDQFQYKMNPTIGIDFKFIDKSIDNLVYRFQIWDSAGQERYRAVSSNHLKGADIILLVYDLSIKNDYNSLAYWIEEIKKYTEQTNVIVIGNKTDLPQDENCITPQEKSMIEADKWEHIKVSCLDCTNISELWKTIINTSRLTKGTSSQEKKKKVVLSCENKNMSKMKKNYRQQKKKEGICC